MTKLITRRDAMKTGAAAAVALAAPVALAEAPRLKLRLLETTDLHVSVVPYDYFRDKPDDTVGLAKTAALIKAARAQARNTLLFDNGDVIQGNPLGDYMAYNKGLKPGSVHPIIAAMNGLDYVCGTLGNHEFNYGLGFLDLSLAGARFPSVCANLYKADGTPFIRPYIVVERQVADEAGAPHTLRIGVIGFVPPQIMQWDKANLEGRVTTRDIVEAAQQYLPALRGEKPDLVVALCHSGIAGGERKGGEENAALHLAKVPGIDAIFTGHQHLVFPGKDFDGIAGVDAVRGSLNGVPAVMAGFWGSHLGIIDLELERAAAGWKVADFKVEARPIYERKDRAIVPKVDAEAAVLAAVKADHEATLAYVRQPVGAVTAPITSYFALVADDPSIQIVTQAQSWYIAAIAATMPGLKGLPLLSAAAPFKSGGRSGPDFFTDIAAGPIAIKDVADIYLYPNTVRAVKVTGAEVRQWLERSAGIFNRIDPARTEEQALIDPSFPAFNFDVIDGVTYQVDLTQPSRYDGTGKLVAPEAHRIVDLAFNGKPIDEAQPFLVATNNYRAGGGGNFPGNDGKTIVIEAPDTNRDVIVRYFVERKTIDPSADGNWRFAKLPASVNVTFLSSPNAAKAMPKGLAITPAGTNAEGFGKFRLDLSA